mgnify:CR=1 FL=1
MLNLCDPCVCDRERCPIGVFSQCLLLNFYFPFLSLVLYGHTISTRTEGVNLLLTFSSTTHNLNHIQFRGKILVFVIKESSGSLLIMCP